MSTRDRAGFDLDRCRCVVPKLEYSRSPPNGGGPSAPGVFHTATWAATESRDRLPLAALLAPLRSQTECGTDLPTSSSVVDNPLHIRFTDSSSANICHAQNRMPQSRQAVGTGGTWSARASPAAFPFRWQAWSTVAVPLWAPGSSPSKMFKVGHVTMDRRSRINRR